MNKFFICNNSFTTEMLCGNLYKMLLVLYPTPSGPHFRVLQLPESAKGLVHSMAAWKCQSAKDFDSLLSNPQPKAMACQCINTPAPSLPMSEDSEGHVLYLFPEFYNGIRPQWSRVVSCWIIHHFMTSLHGLTPLPMFSFISQINYLLLNPCPTASFWRIQTKI